MNSTNVEVVITAKDEASRKLQIFSDKIKGNKKAFQSMAAVGTVAFAGVTAVIASSVKAYAESERNQRQLEHAIIAVSKGTKAQVEEVNKLSNALQKKAGIDGDALNAGIAQLSTFGLQSKSVVALTKSLADLTVNQKGVNAGTEDYIGSANTMAKALNGQFGALQKMGIRFTETQQKLIQFGSETERVKAIQEGFAQNLRETTDTVKGYDVQMGRLKQQFGEIQESIGKALQPAFTKLAEALVPIIDSVTSWIEENPKLTTGIIVLTGALGALSVVLGVIGLALPTVIAGFVMLSPVILPLIGIATSFALIIYSLNESIKILEKDSQLVVLGLKAYWGEFLKFIEQKFKNWILAFELLKLVALEVVNSIKGAFDGFISSVKSAYDSIVSLINKMKEIPSGGIRGAINAVSGFLGRATGGGVQSGKGYMVGENGPEFFSPSANGSITPNHKMAGGGGMNITINMNGGTYLSETVAEQIGDMMISRFKKVVRF